jgi:hypothetical protein
MFVALVGTMTIPLNPTSMTKRTGNTDTPACRNACLREALRRRQALRRAGTVTSLSNYRVDFLEESYKITSYMGA